MNVVFRRCLHGGVQLVALESLLYRHLVHFSLPVKSFWHGEGQSGGHVPEFSRGELALQVLQEEHVEVSVSTAQTFKHRQEEVCKHWNDLAQKRSPAINFSASKFK